MSSQGPRSLVALAKQREWVHTVRDLVEFWFPNDYEVLQCLLDRNGGEIGPEYKPQLLEAPTFLRDNERGWSEIELRETLFPQT